RAVRRGHDRRRARPQHRTQARERAAASRDPRGAALMWLNPDNPQLDRKGQLHHLLTLEGLPAEIIRQILDTAKTFVGVKVKEVPLLRGRSVFNVFFEPSTRTRTTFEIAAKRLSADVINLNIPTSSQSKGE